MLDSNIDRHSLWHNLAGSAGIQLQAILNGTHTVFPESHASMISY